MKRIISIALVLSSFLQFIYAQTEEKPLDTGDFDSLQELVNRKYERIIYNDSLDDEDFLRVKSLVAEAERFRGNIDRDFVLVMNVTDRNDGELRGDTSLKSYIHIVDNSLKRYVISQFLTGRSTNTLILQRDSNMWFYKPGTRNIIRISPAQRLLGGASYADVSNTNYTEYYDPVEIHELTIGKVDAYRVKLQKTNNSTAYEQIEYFVAKNGYRPIKADFYSRSGKALKTMYYRKFEKLEGRIISREWVIVDRLNTNLVTTIQITELNYESIDKSLYTPENIKNF